MEVQFSISTSLFCPIFPAIHPEAVLWAVLPDKKLYRIMANTRKYANMIEVK